MKDKQSRIIAVDFDSTLCKSAYPEIGEPIPYSIQYVTRAKAAGNILILHTCRNGKYLDDALAWCAARGITFDYVNENTPENIARYGDTRKIYADLYFDTNSLNPLRTFGIGENDENASIFDRAKRNFATSNVFVRNGAKTVCVASATCFIRYAIITPSKS